MKLELTTMDTKDIEVVGDAKSSPQTGTHLDKPASELVENATVTLTEEDVR